MSGRKERFVIEGTTISGKSEDQESFVRDVAEINAKYGTDAQAVFDQLARRLEKRALAAVKANQSKDKGGRPRGSKRPTRMKRVRVDLLLKKRGRHSIPAFVKLINRKNVRREDLRKLTKTTYTDAEKGWATQKTVEAIAAGIGCNPEDVILPLEIRPKITSR